MVNGRDETLTCAIFTELNGNPCHKYKQDSAAFAGHKGNQLRGRLRTILQ